MNRMEKSARIRAAIFAALNSGGPHTAAQLAEVVAPFSVTRAALDNRLWNMKKSGTLTAVRENGALQYSLGTQKTKEPKSQPRAHDDGIRLQFNGHSFTLDEAETIYRALHRVFGK
jgi:hypothetical protein